MAEQTTNWPTNVWDQSARYEAAAVGSHCSYHDGWKWHHGEITWLSDWEALEDAGTLAILAECRGETFPMGRERLAVLADDTGGLYLTRIHTTCREWWHANRDLYTMSDMHASSGKNLRAADTERFLAAIGEHLLAESALARSIEECDHEDDGGAHDH